MSSQAIAVKQTAFLAADKIELIKNTIAKGATNDELALFLHHCERTRLDPLARQIYFRKNRTKDGDKITIITAIDGYRLIADRTGKYAGNDDPVFDDEENPRKATVTVYKMVGGVRCAYSATARWDQYYPGDSQGFMWRKMPHLMIGKCAEALALRKAFPAELSGIYVQEEMEQAGMQPVAVEATATHLPGADDLLEGTFSAPPPPKKYDGSPGHQQALKRVLVAKRVPEEIWEVVGERLMGRPSSDIDKVLAEIEP